MLHELSKVGGEEGYGGYGWGRGDTESANCRHCQDVVDETFFVVRHGAPRCMWGAKEITQWGGGGMGGVWAGDLEMDMKVDLKAHKRLEALLGLVIIQSKCLGHSFKEMLAEPLNWKPATLKVRNPRRLANSLTRCIHIRDAVVWYVRGGDLLLYTGAGASAACVSCSGANELPPPRPKWWT